MKMLLPFLFAPMSVFAVTTSNLPSAEFADSEVSTNIAFEGGHCCCPRYDDDDPYEPQEDDGPYAAGASVSFSESVVIFEDSKFSRLRRDCSRFLPCDYRRRNLDAA